MAGGQNVTIKAPKAASIRAMTSAYGRVIPLVYGKGRVQANVIYYTDFTATEQKSKKKTGGKGGGGTQTNVTYTYTVCALFALSEGVASASPGTIWVGKEKGTLSKYGLSYFNGSGSQTALGYVTTNHPTEALNYRNTVYIGAGQLQLGDDPSIPNVNVEILGRYSGTDVGTNTATLGDANPANVIYDLISDSRSGLGLSTSMIGDMTAMKTFCQANILLVSPVYTEAKPARDLIKNLCTVSNTAAYFSEGKIKFVPYGDQTVAANGTTFTPYLTPAYDITEDQLMPNGSNPVKITRKSQSDAYNHVKVNYQNRAIDYNDDIEYAKDQASIERYGERLAPEVTLSEICDKDAARLVAQQILQRTSYIRNTYEFKVDWRYARLEQMDIVTLTEATLGLDHVPVRIISIDEEEDGFFIKAEEMLVGSLGAARYVTQPSSGYLVDYNVSPGSANSSQSVVFEPPISLSGTPQLWIATSGSNVNWAGCNIWVSDDNTTYTMAGTVFGSNRHGTLSVALATGPATDTTHTPRLDLSISKGELSAGTTQDATDLTTLLYIDGELLAYRDINLVAPYTYDIQYLIRGAYGTTIGNHAIGTKVARLDQTIFKYEYDPKFIGRTIYLKFQSFNIYGGNTEDLSTLTPVTYSFAGSAAEPVFGLALQSAFTGPTVQIKWSQVRGAVSYNVRVYSTSTSTTLRTVKVDTLDYVYTWVDSKADGGPYRNLRFYVSANTLTGTSGESFVDVSNAIPAAVTGLVTAPGYKNLFIDWNKSSETDVQGYRVWMSATSGFTPGSGNLIYDGIDNGFVATVLPGGSAIVAGTTYYFRVAAYDVFGVADGFNMSSEVSALALSVAGGIGPNEITNTMIAAGAIDMNKFASGIRPPRVVAALPTIDGTIYKNSDTVLLTTDGQLYRAVSGSWTAAVPAASVTGTLTDAQLSAISAAKVTGTLTDSQLAAIAATKVTGQIVGTQIANGAIITAKIAAGAITSNEIAANTIVAADIAAGTITSTELASNSVTAGKIAAGAIVAGNIAAGVVTATELAAGSVTTAKLAAGAVTANEIAANTITAGKIAAGAIGATELAANSITADKLFVNSQGSVINPDPNFSDASAWSFSSPITLGSGSLASGQSSTTYITASSGVDVHFYSAKMVPIDPTRNYRITANTYAASGNNRAMIWTLDFYNAAGTFISTTTINIMGPNVGSWANSGVTIGPGFTSIPSTAAQFKFNFTFQSSYAGQTGSFQQAMQDLRIVEVIGSTLIQDGAVTTNKVAANAITAGKIAANTITAANIAAGTITTDRIMVGAATAANTTATTHATTFPSSSVWSRVDTITSFTSTGAKVTVNASVYVICSGLSGIAYGVLTMQLRVDGVDKALSAMYDSKGVFTEGGGSTIRFSVALLYQEAFSSGSHTYEINTSVAMYNSSGTAVSTTGSFVVASRVVIQENKV